MLEAFVWMFRDKQFKSHYIYLFSKFIFFEIAALVLFFVTDPLKLFVNIQFVNLIAIILAVFPFLCIQGYFWEMTENVIAREFDIKSANIYNGKIKQIYVIELPELRFFKLVWRGIASIFATFLLLFPFIYMIYKEIIKPDMLPLSMQVLLYLFWAFFIPALLWNYAHRDSVVAVWNIRKAIYLMGNYTGKYIFNIILFIIFYTVDYFILFFLAEVLGIKTITELNSINAIKVLIWTVVAYIKYFYTLYVYAYLLGTIAPSEED